LKISIILATGKIIDVDYIIFCSIIFIEPLLKSPLPFGVLPMAILKVLNCLGGVNKLVHLPADQEYTPGLTKAMEQKMNNHIQSTCIVHFCVVCP
jgi:hypothetical protein